MKIGVDLEMNDAAKRLFGLDDEAVEKAMVVAVNRTAVAAQALIKEATPVGNYPVAQQDDHGGKNSPVVKTGSTLRNSITLAIATPGNPIARVFTNVPYALYVEYGTGVYGEGPGAKRQPIVPVRAKQLSWIGPDGKWVHAKSVQGMRPVAMFRTAIVPIRLRLFQECMASMRQLGAI